MRKLNNIIFLFVIAVFAISIYSCDDKKWAEDYDINWPVSAIESLSSTDLMIDDVLTITGSNLDKIHKIYLNGQECSLVDGSSKTSEVQVVIGRRASTGYLNVVNLYDRSYVYEDATIKVSYPDVIVSEWPDKLVSGEAFIIEGDNVDLITEVYVNGQLVKISNPTETGKIVVPTAGMVIVPGETATIKVTALGYIGVSEVTEVPIEEPSDLFEAAAPIILWDFEAGSPIMEEVENAPSQADINLGGLTKARGNNYYSVINTGENTKWKTYFYIKYGQAVDLSEFHEPNITFLVNTNGNRGYINPFMTQDGERKDNHLTDGNANEGLKYGDNYAVQTEGWEWRSYPISSLYPDFNATGVFENVEMRFITGNVGAEVEDFEIHVDQIMITDGPVNAVAKVFDFEDGNDIWEDDGFGANHAIKSEAPLGGGAKYYSVWLTSAAKWNWTGAIGSYNAVDLSVASDPHLSFIFNTNGKKGMVQFELLQNETKWGGSVNISEYFIQSDGWVSLSIRLADYVGNWGGDATEFDPTASIDYVKLGFTTGNVDAGEEYEINIDDVYITDGPMW